ncbi:MAG: RNA-directed DNA polymerase [Chloroflexota bacterium]
MQQYAYMLPLDMRQFFPSIDHAILRKTLWRKIQDGRPRGLIDRILASGVGVLTEAYDMVYFAGDNLLAPLRPRGLPIGNLTSQFWANCYMHPFDLFVTRELGCGAYLRYVDDLLLFGNDKQELWQWKQAIIERLATMRLTIHYASAEVKPTNHGVRFLGFVVYPDYRLLLRRKGINYQRHLKRLLNDYRAQKLDRARVQASIEGWLNHTRYGDTWGLRRAMLREVRL